MTLGKRIAAQRKRLGMTQEQLAERLGITAQAVSKWENDQSCPDITMLPLLGDLFEISTDELLGRVPVRKAEVIHDQRTDEKNERTIEFTGPSIWVGILVLLTGGLLLVGRLMSWDVSLWGILWPAALMVFGISGLVSGFSVFRLCCGVFGCWFLLDELGIATIDEDVIFPVILVILGIGMVLDAIFRPLRRKKALRKGSGLKLDDGIFTYDQSFSTETCRVDTECLEGGKVEVSFGEYTVDLSGVKSVASGCTLDISCSFGELTVLVPEIFWVNWDGDSAFGSIEVEGQPSANPEGTIHIHARSSFGSVEVQYQSC